MSYMFRAQWPIRDPHAPAAQLAAEAASDLPKLLRQARAVPCGPGRFHVAPSWAVPGSGGVTASVLVYEAPARPTPRRAYHR